MTRVLSLALCILTLVLCIGGFSNTAYASTVDMDNTSVLDDLIGATIDGLQFDVKNFPANDKGTLRMLAFSEYCYSERLAVSKYYGIYLYIYNPKQLSIVESELNKIQIATEYGSDGSPIVYSKLNITLLNATDDRLFYKFKISDVSNIYTRVSANVDSRRYDVSGIELLTDGDYNATEYTVGGTFTYSGFADGCGSSPSSDGNLTCSITQLDVVVIDNIEHTYYRTWRTEPIKYAEQLNTVYFGVDKSISDKFDNLYSIDAEAYRYLTSPILQIKNKDTFLDTGNVEFYNKLQQQVGKNMDGSGVGLSLSGSTYFYNISFAYNNIDTLAWLLPYENKNEYVSASSDTLLSYMQSYSKNKDKNILGKYSSDLFFDNFLWNTTNSDIEYGGNGYIRIYVDNSGDYDFKLVGSDSLGPWDSLYDNTGMVVDNIKPLIAVSYADIEFMTDDDLSNSYYIDMSDVSKFRSFVKECERNNEICYVFRFAKTPFYTNSVKEIISNKSRGMWSQEVVFLDFDIISLGYMEDGIVTNLPAVMSPIDIVAGLPTVPDNSPPWWVWLIVALLVVIILAVIFPPIFTGVLFILRLLLKLIFLILRGLWFVLSAPFKAIAKAIAKRKNGGGKT